MLRIVFLGGHLTQSLPNKHCVFVWLFCSSSVYESKLSTQPRNKKAYHFVIGFVANIGASLEEFAVDVRAILATNLKNL
jgi:adenylosuccinate lyase